MQTLSPFETGQPAGGILWSTPAAIAIMDSASLGPLAFAFSVGYGIGTFLYDNVISD